MRVIGLLLESGGPILGVSFIKGYGAGTRCLHGNEVVFQFGRDDCNYAVLGE